MIFLYHIWIIEFFRRRRNMYLLLEFWTILFFLSCINYFVEHVLCLSRKRIHSSWKRNLCQGWSIWGFQYIFFSLFWNQLKTSWKQVRRCSLFDHKTACYDYLEGTNEFEMTYMEDERNSAGEFGTRAKSGIGKKRRWIENIKRDKQSAKFRNPQRRIKISKNQVEFNFTI